VCLAFLQWDGCMQSREIILAAIENRRLPRCGLTFDGGRINDMRIEGIEPYGYRQKRWTEGKRSYYDDE
jgi:hypothetical protein